MNSRQQVYQWPSIYRDQAREMRDKGRTYQHIANALATRHKLKSLSHWTVRSWLDRDSAKARTP